MVCSNCCGKERKYKLKFTTKYLKKLFHHSHNFIYIDSAMTLALPVIVSHSAAELQAAAD